MFHLFSVLWDLLRHHRHHWFGVVALVVAAGAVGYQGMQTLNAAVTARYEQAEVSQQPSVREQLLQRRMRRRALRNERMSVRRHASAPLPPFGDAVFPVDRVPDWGAMRTPAEWTRSYGQMTAGDFVALPAYDLDVLTLPMADLIAPFRRENIPAITAKLTYSTRFFGAYDIDAGEFTAPHPGIDIKLPLGTPVGSIGGGRVAEVAMDEHLGLFVMVEHAVPGEGAVFSIYGHLGSAAVAVGQDIEPGQTLGAVGMTGKTTAPHLHLQVDRGVAGQKHVPYNPDTLPSRAEALARTVHPVELIDAYRPSVARGERAAL